LNALHSAPGDEKEQRTAEILKKIRGLEIKTRALVETAFAGDYHSVFKGRGMNFEEVREYQPGDEIRAIDWNVTARLGSPFVKKFTEERELTVMLIVDVSASGNFGSTSQSKRELAAEVACLLAFSAIRNNDKGRSSSLQRSPRAFHRAEERALSYLANHSRNPLL
jgi:uncharacterized protein (DUF58 family)